MAARADEYAAVLRYAPGPCLLLANGTIEAANPEAVDVTGIPLSKLVGAPLLELVLADHHDRWHQALGEAKLAPSSVHLRLVHQLAPVELSIRCLPDGRVMVGVRSTTEEHRYSAMARAELTHDPLTGLSNRHHLLAQLQDRLNTQSRVPLALIGLWIDELPSMTESRGPRVVDRVVKDVGSRIQARLRGPDIVGRFEPAGFVTILGSDAGTAQLTEIAGRLRDEVAFPVELGTGLVSFTASVAVGTLNGRRPSIERILSRLDDAATRLGSGPGDRTEVLEF